MRILLTGANGFIGSHIYKALKGHGHAVVASVRNPDAFIRKHRGAEAIAIDMNRDVEPASWLPRLEGIDAVINCAGALQSGPDRIFATFIPSHRRRFSRPASPQAFAG